MKKYNDIVLLILALCNTNFIDAARASTITQKQTPLQRAPRNIQQKTQKIIYQPMQQQQLIVQPTYAQALTLIRTTMPSNMILRNNNFTPEFINFIKSFNLSESENIALLQAGVNIHAAWTDNNDINKQMALTFKNNIEAAAQNLKQAPQIAPQPIPVQIKKQPQLPAPQQQKSQQKKPAVITPPTKVSPPLKPMEQIPAGPALTGGNFPTNNLIMILDPKIEETLERRVGAMVMMASTALYEQAAPIVTTSNVLQIIAQIIERIGINNLQKLKNAPYNQIQQFAMQLLQSHGLHGVNRLNLILLSLISLESFNYYLHNSANIVLIIPKQYIASNMPNAANINGNAQAQACGFNTHDMTMLTDITSNNLIKQLQIQQSAFPLRSSLNEKGMDEETFITKLTSLFIPQKRNGQLISPEQDTKWVAYITGHGHPAHETIGHVHQQFQINKSNLAILTSGKVILNANNLAIKTRAEEYIKKYEKILQSKSNWPDSQLIPETAGIVGISAMAFSQLITFFNNNLSMGYLHYVSCFAGGYNQSFINDILSSLDAHFIVSTEGIQESSVKGTVDITFSSQKPHIRITNQAFTGFFKLLRLFISQPEEFVKIKEGKKEPVAQILRTLVPDMQKSNQPFVRFPGAGVFGALTLGKNSKNLTKTIVKAHEIENKSIDVTDPTINIVIVTPSRINVPLIFKKNIECAIVSPTPTTITAGHETINVFKEINFEGRLQQFLYDIIHLNARAHTQTFVVNELIGILYDQSGLPIKPNSPNIIHNLIIQMKGVPGSKFDLTSKPSMQQTLLSAADIQYSRIGVNVQVIFELNGIIYQCTMGIKDFDDSDLPKIFQQITFTSPPVQTINMNAIANQFLTPQEITKLKKPITLESIAKFIDSKIDIQ